MPKILRFECFVTFAFVTLLVNTATVSAASIMAATPNVMQIPAPASVLEGALESNTDVFVFQEQSNFTLPLNLAVDAMNVGANILPDGSGGVAGIIPAGTKVDSFYIHFDAEGQPTIPELSPWAITWQLPDQILGIIYSSSRLDASDFVRSPATIYPNGEPFRGTTGAAEGNDLINFNTPNEIIAQQSVTVVLDQIRVIFAVPEPTSATLMLSVLVTFVSRRPRFDRAYTLDIGEWVSVDPKPRH